MAVNVTETLRKALLQLEKEKARIDRQITAVRTALDGLNDWKALAVSGPRSRPALRRRQMSAAARRKIGLRMKAYWNKKRATAKESTRKAPVRGK